MSSTNTAGGANRYGWVDYSKGICIIGVVTLYVGHAMTHAFETRGWMQYWTDFARPFRMPDFFLISGLFLARVIDRSWLGYLDKKVVHYLYFYVVWTVIHFAAVQWAGILPWDDHTLSSNLIVWIVREPFLVLWFIQMLPVFFLVTRLTKRIPWWVMWVAAALLQTFPISSIGDLDWVQVRHFCERYVYFYSGYAFATYVFRFSDWVEKNRRTALWLFFAWIVTNATLTQAGVHEFPVISLVLAFMGIGGVITAGTLLSRVRWMGWLRYLGEHSIVSYLGFFIPMSLMITYVKHTGLVLDAGSTGFLVAALSMLCAMVLYWLTRGTLARFLFQRPQWICIPNSAPKPAASMRPSAE